MRAQSCRSRRAVLRPDAGGRRGRPPRRGRSAAGEPGVPEVQRALGLPHPGVQGDRAKTKGRAERPISYVRSSFFYGREFVSDDDLNARARRWLDTVANVRVHGTLKQRPVVRFEDERGRLLPLAHRPYRSVVPVAARQAAPELGGPVVAVERQSLAEYAKIAEAAS